MALRVDYGQYRHLETEGERMDYRRGARRTAHDRRDFGPVQTDVDRRAGDRRGLPDRRERVPDASAVTAAIDPTPRPVRMLRRVCARLDHIESRLGLG